MKYGDLYPVTSSQRVFYKYHQEESESADASSMASMKIVATVKKKVFI
jgi:hypothetical protein